MSIEPARLSATLCFVALEALSICVFVVTGTGEVRMMNPLAEKLAASKAPIGVRNRRLKLWDARLDDELRENLRKASLAPPGRTHSPAGTIVIPNDRGDSLLLMVMPLPPDTGASSVSERLAAVLVGDPSHSRGAEPDPALIKALYGLTAAETRVALAIVRGQSLTEYARKAKVSSNTAYSQAKSVFAKTGCRRQAELVAKVLNRPILRIARIRRRAKTGNA